MLNMQFQLVLLIDLTHILHYYYFYHYYYAFEINKNLSECIFLFLLINKIHKHYELLYAKNIKKFLYHLQIVKFLIF